VLVESVESVSQVWHSGLLLPKLKKMSRQPAAVLLVLWRRIRKYVTVLLVNGLE